MENARFTREDINLKLYYYFIITTTYMHAS